MATTLRMRFFKTFCTLCFIFLGVNVSAWGSATTPDEVFSIQQDEKTLTIHYGPNGTEKRVVSIADFIDPKDDFKANSFKRADIAADNKTVVLEIMYDNCCTSYPIPMVLAVFQKNKPDQKYSSEMPIWDWKFYYSTPGVIDIALTVGPTHGNCAEYRLYDISSGKITDTAECTAYKRDPATHQDITSPAPLPKWMK